MGNLSVKIATGINKRSGEPYKPTAQHRLERLRQKALREGQIKKQKPLKRCFFNPKYCCDPANYPKGCPPTAEKNTLKPKKGDKRPCQA